MADIADAASYGSADSTSLLLDDGAAPYIVGIGASAGGLEALESFFDNVPAEPGMAFVIVQHLSPDFPSLMDEILARRTRLPVNLVEDGVTVQPNRVYLIPARKEMIISQGRLLLSDKGRDQELSLPIDVFFRSLAQDCGPRAAAIVLSGGGTDGSRGVRAVHEAGGLVLVQNLESAQFDGMPKTAQDAGVADFVVPPDQMPGVLLQHLRARDSENPASRAELKGMRAVYAMLEKEFGIDFTQYKPSTVTRRIERRLQLARAEDIEIYLRRLREDHQELDVLYRDLLIGVTRFFRNEEAFRVLEMEVLPQMWRTLPADAPLRVWVAGCATGEEVYSLAILLSELNATLGERPLKIFATDVHRGSLEQATRGLYDARALSNVSPERRERFFLQRGNAFQVAPEVRQLVVFAVHNVTRDAPFTRVDLISCRNMLIYLQPPAQQKVLNLFHFALNRGGVLFLGPSESAGALSQDFESIDKHWRIYRKYSGPRVGVDTTPRLARATIPRPLTPASSPLPAAARSMSQLFGVYDALLDEFMPPSLLVNEANELVHAFGGAARFLELSDGRQRLDVLELVEPELRLLLMGGLSRALKQGEPQVFSGLRLQRGEPDTEYRVTVRRLRNNRSAPPHQLISIEPLGPVSVREPAPVTKLELPQASSEQLRALEEELYHTKENLQAASEELETSNEELQAANEELLASNEELQTTNEELQSVNEELYSVNAEYQRKIGDLTELANDMENLLASTDIGTVFLDRQLRIRKFTPQLSESFQLMAHDIGRPISAFSNNIDYPQLSEDLERVLHSGGRVERELRDRQHRTFFVRVLPYRANGTVDGVVLTLIDVSGLKAAEDALFHERYLLNSLLASVPDAIYFKDARGRFIRANHALAHRLGLSDPREAVGKTGFELPGHERALAVHQQDDAVLRSGVAQHYKLEKRELPNGGDEWDLVTRLPLHNREGEVVGIIGIFRNVTEQKRAEERIREAVHRRDQFLAMLSHELRNPLGAIVAATSLLKQPATPDSRRPQLIDVLERQSLQMARLLDDLLEVSRVTQDKIELKKRVLDLQPVIRDAVSAVREQMKSRGVHFSTEIAAGPIYVDGDPARLQQIQVNLLNNAAKYTPRGGHACLKVTREDREVVLSVKDDGVGIPPNALEDVFELFVQSSRTLDRSEGGLGVGLTLVRGLVQKHGGSVSARSDGAGKGSEFIVRLPLAEPPEHAPLRPPSGTQPALRKVERVAVIEDNADSRVMLCELLELAGMKCQTASTGAAGLALIEELLPDVALVDIGLPELDGLELARRVRSNPKLNQVRLVALTGYGQREDRESARDAGFDQHVVKPIDPEALVRLLTQMP